MFKQKDIKIVQQAISYYDNNERNNAIQEMKKIPFFKTEISWFIMSIIEDLDYKDKGIEHNRTREYLVQALNWVKSHQKGGITNESDSI